MSPKAVAGVMSYRRMGPPALNLELNPQAQLLNLFSDIRPGGDPYEDTDHLVLFLL